MCSSHSVSRFVLNTEVIRPDYFNFPPVTQLMKSVWVRCWEHESSWPSVQPGVCVCPSVQPSEGYEMKPPNPSIVPCPDWLTGREKKQQRNGSKQELYKSSSASTLKSFFFLSCFITFMELFGVRQSLLLLCLKKTKKLFLHVTASIPASIQPSVHPSFWPWTIPQSPQLSPARRSHAPSSVRVEREMTSTAGNSDWLMDQKKPLLHKLPERVRERKSERNVCFSQH